MAVGMSLFTATGTYQRVCYIATTRKQRVETRSNDPPPPVLPPTHNLSERCHQLEVSKPMSEQSMDSSHPNHYRIMFPKIPMLKPNPQCNSMDL